MYILKNAWTSIKRNKGRNILIGIIVVVIAASCAVTLSIVNSANNIVDAYEDKYQIEASIGMNRNNLMNSFKEEGTSQEDMINSFNEIEEVTVEEIENYGNSDYVESYYYTYSLGIDGKDLTEATDQLVKETTETNTTTKKFDGDFPGMPGGESSTTTTKRTEKIENMRAQNGAFTLTGYNSYSAMTEFIEGSYTITSGEVSSDFEAYNCVISEELASLNEIEVGDTITLVSTNNTKKTYDLVVTGIYTENTDDASDMRNMFSNSANNIITNSTVVQNILDDDEELTATVTPTFILKSSDVIEAFTSEVSEKGLSDFYTVTTNLDEVESATKSITNVKTFAITFLVITLIIGGVVLLVINMINIRERKYEIGVLRTIGMSKLRVISQFIIELVLVAFVSILLGAGLGSLCSVKVANKLLENEISNATSDTEKIKDNFGGGDFNPGENGGGMPGNDMKFNGVVSVNQVDNISAVVDFKVLSELMCIGILLTLISSLSACVAISRFSPLSILKERS